MLLERSSVSELHEADQLPYGSIAKDGRQIFRTYDGFNRFIFIKYFKELQRRYGRVTVIADRISPHRARAVKEFLRKNKNVKIIYLPKRSPYLNAIE